MTRTTQQLVTISLHDLEGGEGVAIKAIRQGFKVAKARARDLDNVENLNRHNYTLGVLYDYDTAELVIACERDLTRKEQLRSDKHKLYEQLKTQFGPDGL